MRNLKVAFAVLESVAELQPIGVSELSRHLEIPKTSVQRSLATLAEIHYIVPTAGSKWQLSNKVLKLTTRLELQENVRRAALPVMQRLCKEVDETIHLTILEGKWIVVVGIVEPPRSLRTTSKIGNMRLAHTTSTGKAMLAMRGDAEVAELCGEDLERVTTRSIDSYAKLCRVLAKIRQQGFAINDREYNLETASIAAPILDWEGRAVAAISISAPASRMPKSRWEPYGQAVVRAASEIRL